MFAWCYMIYMKTSEKGKNIAALKRKKTLPPPTRPATFLSSNGRLLEPPATVSPKKVSKRVSGLHSFSIKHTVFILLC